MSTKFKVGDIICSMILTNELVIDVKTTSKELNIISWSHVISYTYRQN
jgi:hypothetical protein